MNDLAPEIAAGVQAGDATAAERLIAWFRPRLLLFVQARGGDRALADDVAQEVLMAVIRALQAGQVRDLHSLPAFVFGVARNQLATARRAIARAKEEALEAAHAVTVNPVDIVAVEERTRLHAAIDALEPVDRRILRLTLAGGHGLAEIAAAVGLTHDAVRQRKSRAIRRLTAQLRPASQNVRLVRPTDRPLVSGAE
ncbi:MAG: sigma-70 family RNA polymerase sigma factor [Vicinamibacterales bacterium]